MQAKTDRLGLEIFLLLCLAFLWGSSYLFIKLALEDIPPVTLIAVRVLVAAVILLAVLILNGKRLPKELDIWRLFLVQSFLNATGAWTILAWGQQYVDSGLAAVLNSTSPIFVFFLTAFVTRHEPVRLLKLTGALLGLAGVVLIVGVEVLDNLGLHAGGQLAALFGAFLYACAAVNGSRFSGIDPVVTAAGTMVCAAVCLVPASLVIDRPWLLDPSLKAVLAAMALSVLCTGLALVLYFRLIITLGSMGVASQAYLRAGIGVGLGMIVLGESFTLTVGMGITLAILGVVAINAPSLARG